MKYLLFLSILFLLSCVKKQSPELDLANKVISEEIIINKAQVVNNANFDSSKYEKIDNILKNEIILNEFKEDIVEIVEPQTSIQKEYDYDQLFPDSIWTEYMTKRGDYLSLIAYREYNNANEWRRIYQWNRKHWEEKGIGPDRDNPNFIYPYRELDLKKPANNAIEWAYDYYLYSVDNGETLWTIAKKVYGDELAWVVLFWDNENLLNTQDGKLIANMQLKVRSQLWPDIE